MFSVTSSSLYAAPVSVEPKEGLFFATTEEISKNVAQSNIVLEKPSSDLHDLNDYSFFPYDVKEVAINPELRSFLQKALQGGKKVYLYGGLTSGKYEELLNQPLEFKVSNEAEGGSKIARH
ncbi:hypothetical protein PAEAM_10270 [Paenibacillus sp. GM1FR]|uniref:hypothetical protein n=1 Tax=Paenibacillus sp. GM1FR TaxID=2059267 RepID=UPI000C27395B|nr:hypothetical protein [Paenibacillus sp. GM1FR]PJN63558.1 hypothetical protein PAEAM_10270 [Paenibacillus sp. GM1FR]